MKILKRYILELCFILSFALPFIKGANADNGRSQIIHTSLN